MNKCSERALCVVVALAMLVMVVPGFVLAAENAGSGSNDVAGINASTAIGLPHQPTGTGTGFDTGQGSDQFHKKTGTGTGFDTDQGSDRHHKRTGTGTGTDLDFGSDEHHKKTGTGTGTDLDFGSDEHHKKTGTGTGIDLDGLNKTGHLEFMIGNETTGNLNVRARLLKVVHGRVTELTHQEPGLVAGKQKIKIVFRPTEPIGGADLDIHVSIEVRATSGKTWTFDRSLAREGKMFVIRPEMLK